MSGHCSDCGNTQCLCPNDSEIMPSKPTPLELEYKSIVALAYENPNLLEYIGSLEAEREAMLNFIREIVEIWDSDGDSGFPLYESRKSIVDRYRSLTKIIK